MQTLPMDPKKLMLNYLPASDRRNFILTSKQNKEECAFNHISLTYRSEKDVPDLIKLLKTAPHKLNNQERTALLNHENKAIKEAFIQYANLTGAEFEHLFQTATKEVTDDNAHTHRGALETIEDNWTLPYLASNKNLNHTQANQLFLLNLHKIDEALAQNYKFNRDIAAEAALNNGLFEKILDAATGRDNPHDHIENPNLLTILSMNEDLTNDQCQEILELDVEDEDNKFGAILAKYKKLDHDIFAVFLTQARNEILNSDSNEIGEALCHNKTLNKAQWKTLWDMGTPAMDLILAREHRLDDDMFQKIRMHIYAQQDKKCLKALAGNKNLSEKQFDAISSTLHKGRPVGAMYLTEQKETLTDTEFKNLMDIAEHPDNRAILLAMMQRSQDDVYPTRKKRKIDNNDVTAKYLAAEERY